MQQKVEALLRRIPARHFILGALLVAVLAAGLAGGVSAMAASPAAGECWVISVDGRAVAAGSSESALFRIYDDVVTGYQDEDTISTKVLNEIRICRAESDDSGEALPRQAGAVAEALSGALSVQTVRRVELVEEIPFATVTVEDESMYNDESVTEEGHAGEQVLCSSVTSINGEAVLTKLCGVEVTQAPQDTVIRVGTQERPEFIWPTHGSYTGSYGIDTINGANRRHTGIDIAAGAGTDICAARAGKVVYAGWDGGGYGNLVVIEHDNGTHTYYGHNSSILVSVGDDVEQGEHIAEMGATGRVTGVHCHFEIRSGSYHGLYVSATVNPMDYLSLGDL